MCRISVITSLFNCQQYLEGYFEAAAKILDQDTVEILLIHNQPSEGELQIINSHLPKLPFIKHIVIEREGLYATWNRGARMAKGKYVTTWNVDDVRLPNSLNDQADALDINPDAMLAYGNFKIVGRYGDTDGKDVSEPEFDPKNDTFRHNFHIGCFPMWRKSVHETIGYFDEQFRLIADLDFQIRVATKFAMVKVNKYLGYYLEGTASNLSSNFSIQDKEHTVLHLRYGNFNSIFLTHLFNALKNFKVFQYKWFGVYYPMNQWLPSDKVSYLVKFPRIIFSIAKWPRHMAKKYIKKYIIKIKRKKEVNANLN